MSVKYFNDLNIKFENDKKIMQKLVLNHLIEAML